MVVDRDLDLASEFRRAARLRTMATLDVRARSPGAGRVRFAFGADEDVGPRDPVRLNEVFNGKIGVASCRIGRRWCAP